jgi:hypothetical protein
LLLAQDNINELKGQIEDTSAATEIIQKLEEKNSFLEEVIVF